MSSFTINRVVLVGRLARDPELRLLPSGLKVCGLRLACNSARRDADGDFQEQPNYFDANVFGAPARNVNRYTRKGSRVAVDGRLEWREWETPDQQAPCGQRRGGTRCFFWTGLASVTAARGEDARHTTLHSVAYQWFAGQG